MKNRQMPITQRLDYGRMRLSIHWKHESGLVLELKQLIMLHSKKSLIWGLFRFSELLMY